MNCTCAVALIPFRSGHFELCGLSHQLIAPEIPPWCPFPWPCHLSVPSKNTGLWGGPSNWRMNWTGKRSFCRIPGQVQCGRARRSSLGKAWGSTCSRRLRVCVPWWKFCSFHPPVRSEGLWKFPLSGGKALEGCRDGGVAPVLTWEREQPRGQGAWVPADCLP